MEQVTIIFINKAKALAFMNWLEIHGQDRYFDWMEDDACNSVASFTFNFDHKLIHATGQLPHCSEEKGDV